MSTFEVLTRRITQLDPHPNADKLELVVIGGYKAVVQTGVHAVGDLILYIPDDSVFLNMTVAKTLGVDAYLVGKYKNRVKAIRLRGIMSQGIVLPISIVNEYLETIHEDPIQYEHEELGNTLEIEKYEEPIPIEMMDHARKWPTFISHYNVENIKRPESMTALKDGEEVVVTEKLHGRNITVALGPGLEDGELAFVCSHGYALKESNTNIFWDAAKKYNLIEKLQQIRLSLSDIQSVSLHGEVVGVQDLKYGYANGDIGFYAFDIRIDGQFLDFADAFKLCSELDIPFVPVLYHGPYSYETVKELASGDTILTGRHMREGVVVRAAKERFDLIGGRVSFKFVSDDYLMRRGGSELH